MGKSMHLVLSFSFFLGVSSIMSACYPEPYEREECVNRGNAWQIIEENTGDDELRSELEANETAPMDCPTSDQILSIPYGLLDGDIINSGPEYLEAEDQCCYMTSYMLE